MEDHLPTMEETLGSGYSTAKQTTYTSNDFISFFKEFRNRISHFVSRQYVEKQIKVIYLRRGSGETDRRRGKEKEKMKGKKKRRTTYLYHISDFLLRKLQGYLYLATSRCFGLSRAVELTLLGSPKRHSSDTYIFSPFQIL